MMYSDTRFCVAWPGRRHQQQKLWSSACKAVCGSKQWQSGDWRSTLLAGQQSAVCPMLEPGTLPARCASLHAAAAILSASPQTSQSHGPSAQQIGVASVSRARAHIKRSRWTPDSALTRQHVYLQSPVQTQLVLPQNLDVCRSLGPSLNKASELQDSPSRPKSEEYGDHLGSSF